MRPLLSWNNATGSTKAGTISLRYFTTLLYHLHRGTIAPIPGFDMVAVVGTLHANRVTDLYVGYLTHGTSVYP
jgi:hypothetical protein